MVAATAPYSHPPQAGPGLLKGPNWYTVWINKAKHWHHICYKHWALLGGQSRQSCFFCPLVLPTHMIPLQSRHILDNSSSCLITCLTKASKYKYAEHPHYPLVMSPIIHQLFVGHSRLTSLLTKPLTSFWPQSCHCSLSIQLHSYCYWLYRFAGLFRLLQTLPNLVVLTAISLFLASFATSLYYSPAYSP